LTLRAIAREAIVAGTVGAVAMMPFGFLFRALGMRIGHYGPKFASLYLDDPGRAALFIQHLVLGWVSALPLCLVMLQQSSAQKALVTGSLYGIAYYVFVNALGLPMYFGDPLPWSLGAPVVIPSLLTHIVFGAAVALCIYYLRQDRSAT